YGGQTLPRLLDNAAIATLNTTTITLLDHGPLQGGYTTTALNWNGDGKSDVFVATLNKGYLFSGATIASKTSVVIADRLFELTHDNINNFAVTPIVGGDVNGDGLEDLLFFDEAAGSGNRIYVLAGRPNVRLPGTALTLALNADVIITMGEHIFGTDPNQTRAKAYAARLGDVNNDGYDDIGVTLDLEIEGPQEASAFIFYGSSDYARGPGAPQKAKSLTDANIALTRQLPGQLTGGLGLG